MVWKKKQSLKKIQPHLGELSFQQHQRKMKEASNSNKKQRGKKQAVQDAVAAYIEAVRTNGRQGLINLQALSNERMAIFQLEHGEKADAEYGFEEASRLYAEWGATAKEFQLLERLRKIRTT